MESILKTQRLDRANLNEFVTCYQLGALHRRKPTWTESALEGRWREYHYDEIMARDKVSLDLLLLRDESLEESASLHDPNPIARKIACDMCSALEKIKGILSGIWKKE